VDFKLSINDTHNEVNAEAAADRRLTVTIGGTGYDVRYTRIDTHQINLQVDGKNVRAFVARNGSGKTVVIDGKTLFVEDLAHPGKAGSGRKKSTGIPDSVTPPMPAVVIAVLVKPGDTVVKGQGVVVVSAMKMETTLAAPHDGVVGTIRIAEGDKVNPGDILVDIEKHENPTEDTP
jgi:3-methylcrotonyl-CoA carboxylase alpha subunit